MATKKSNDERDYRTEIREDDVYLALRQSVKGIEKTTNIERLLAEAKNLHEGRTSRTLYKEAMTPSGLYAAAMNDLHARSRLTTINAELTREASMLTKAISRVKKHLRTKYGGFFQSITGTAADRDAMLEKIIEFASETASDLTSAVEVLSIYVKDIDQAGYDLRMGVDLLKITVERPGQIV